MQTTKRPIEFTPEEAARAAMIAARQNAGAFNDLRYLLSQSRWRQLAACHKAFNSGRIFSDQLRNDLESLLEELEREIDAGTEMVARPVCLANTSEGPIMENRTVAERTPRAEALHEHKLRVGTVLEAVYRVHDQVATEAEVERLRQRHAP